MLKAIGTDARKEIQKMLGCKVHFGCMSPSTKTGPRTKSAQGAWFGVAASWEFKSTPFCLLEIDANDGPPVDAGSRILLGLLRAKAIGVS